MRDGRTGGGGVAVGDTMVGITPMSFDAFPNVVVGFWITFAYYIFHLKKSKVTLEKVILSPSRKQETKPFKLRMDERDFCIVHWNNELVNIDPKMHIIQLSSVFSISYKDQWLQKIFVWNNCTAWASLGIPTRTTMQKLCNNLKRENPWNGID